MSTKIITEIICDNCGKEADHENLNLAYQSKAYELDLCDDCIGALEKTLSPLLDSARRAKSSVTPMKRRPSGAMARGLDPEDVRTWAKSKGIKVPKRGRIPGSVLDRYQAAS